MVADFVGRFAEWTPAKVMTREEILALARHGVQFGSHPAGHTAIDCFTSRELTRTLTRHA